MSAPASEQPLAEQRSAALVPRATLRRELARCHGAAGVVHLDIVRFGDVNERWGPAVGDSALALVVRRALRAAPADALLSDAGSTLTAVILDATPLETREVVGRLMTAVREPIHLGSIELRLDVRAGYACAGPGEVGLDLLDHAQAAYRAAKEQERVTPAEYGEEIGRVTSQAQRMEAELQAAIAEGDLRAHFQPVVELRGGRVVGLEALVRWPRRRGRLLLPDEFLPVAEAAGLMPDVGQWMLDRVLEAVRRLRPARPDQPLRIWINLGADEVAAADEVMRRIESAIADGTLNPREIGFEVTESTVLADLDSAVDGLAALRRLGVEIALDDFGTGYSSLSYLRRLPVTAVKIDRSFVAGLGTAGTDEVIVEAVIDLAHALGLRVIAEGVETAEQAEALVALGADEAQGFLFGPPVPIDELVARVDAPWASAGTTLDRVGTRVDGLPGYGSPRSRLLLAALETAHDAIVVTTAANTGATAHEIVHVNNRFIEDTGIQAADVLGQSLDDLLPSSTVADLPTWYAEVLASGKSATRELRMTHADGTPYLTELVVSPILDEHGVHTHWLHASRDISERRALEDERARFEWMIEQSDSLVAMYDTRGEWLYANAAMRAAIGVERDAPLDGVTNETVGVTRGPLAELALGEVREQLNETGRWSGPWVLDNRNTGVATEVHCELQQIADPLDAGRSFIVAVGRDVTAENARARAEQRRRRLSGLVAQLAHRAVEDSVDTVLADFEAVLAPFGELLGSDLMYVNLLDGAQLRTTALWSYEPMFTDADGVWREPVPVERVTAWLALIASGRVVVDPPPGPWSAELAASFPGRPFGSQLMAGLTMDGKLLGVLGAATYAGGRDWSDDEVAAVEQLAHVLANLLQRQRTEVTLHDDVRTAATRAALDQVQMGVTEWALGLDRGSIADGLDVHLQRIGELLGADTVTVALLEGGQLLRRSRWPRTTESPLGRPTRMMYAEMLTKLPDLEPLIVEDIDDVDAAYATTWRSDPTAPRAAMIVPLGAGGHFDGVLAVVVEHDARCWTDTEVAFVRGIAGVISSHIGRIKVEASLRGSQARLEALLDGSSDLVLVVDDIGIVRYANSAVRRNLGMSIEQIVGLSGFELIHPDDQPLAAQRFAALMRGRPTENTRVRAMRSDGTVAGWWEILSGNQRDPLVGGTILTCRDVTVRVDDERAEAVRVARLRHTFELAQQALDIGPDAFLAQLDDSCAAIAEMLGADAAWVVQIDEAREVLASIGRAGTFADGEVTIPFASMPNWVQRLRRPSPVHLRPGDVDEPWVAEWRARSGSRGEMMSVAMSVAGQLVGELGVAVAEGERGWDDDAMAYLRIVADTVAHVLERERLDAALRASEARFRILSETAADVVILIDDRGTIAYASPSSATLLGYPPAELIGQNATLLLPSGEGDLVRLLDDRSSRDGSATAELQMRRADGDVIWVAHSTSAVLDARTNSRVTYRISLRDITERKRLETELSWQALHDPLTGLGNRIHLQRRLADATAEIGIGRGLAVLLIDLDKFKQVNDTLGHAHGDEVLRIVSARLTKLTRPSDTLSRTGGDEFVVLCPNTDASDAVAIGERIVRVLCEPIAAHGEVATIGGSIGVSHSHSAADDGDHLLTEADRAMYVAKELGGNRVVEAT